MKLSEIKLDEAIYPRKGVSAKLVEAYVSALDLQAEDPDLPKFPPIEVQQVSGYLKPGDVAWLLVDGAHRLAAYAQRKIETIEAAEWQPGVVLDYETNKNDLRLRSANLNVTHGAKLSASDQEKVACDIAENDREGKHTEQVIARMLGVSRVTVNGWISAIRNRQRASRDNEIIKLARLGWTQAEIADTVGVAQQRVTQITNNVTPDKISNLISEGRDMPYIADLHRMSLPLAWSLRLEGKTDQERFSDKELNWGLRTWDLWNFNKCDERFGDNWPGRIPAQLVAHTLFYFSKPGDLVFDPMAGGGVVPDTCLAFGRKCRAFDLSTRESRPEIQKHEWALDNMTWPALGGYGKKPHLIFFDPPYFSKMKADYAEKAEGNGTSISDLSRTDYLRFFAQFFELARKNVREGGRLAFLNADWRDFQSTAAMDEDPTAAITMFDYARLMTDAGWQITHTIDTPLSSERFTGNVVSHMQSNHTLGTTRRTLLIAR